MMALGQMINIMEKEFIISKMVRNIMAIGEIINRMVTGFSNILMGKNMKAILKIISKMDMENIFTKMEIDMKVNMWMINRKV